jgi:hypothetical protein
LKFEGEFEQDGQDGQDIWLPNGLERFEKNQASQFFYRYFLQPELRLKPQPSKNKSHPDYPVHPVRINPRVELTPETEESSLFERFSAEV